MGGEGDRERERARPSEGVWEGWWWWCLPWHPLCEPFDVGGGGGRGCGGGGRRTSFLPLGDGGLRISREMEVKMGGERGGSDASSNVGGVRKKTSSSSSSERWGIGEEGGVRRAEGEERDWRDREGEGGEGGEGSRWGGGEKRGSNGWSANGSVVWRGVVAGKSSGRSGLDADDAMGGGEGGSWRKRWREFSVRMAGKGSSSSSGTTGGLDGGLASAGDATTAAGGRPRTASLPPASTSTSQTEPSGLALPLASRRTEDSTDWTRLTRGSKSQSSEMTVKHESADPDSREGMVILAMATSTEGRGSSGYECCRRWRPGGLGDVREVRRA